MKKNRLFDVGKLRHRVGLYATTRTDDGSGGFERSDPSGETKVQDYWAHIQPVTAMERQWGEQFTEQTTHSCWLRYNSLVKERMILRRYVPKGHIDYYIISAFDPDNLGEWMLLALREGGPL